MRGLPWPVQAGPIGRRPNRGREGWSTGDSGGQPYPPISRRRRMTPAGISARSTSSTWHVFCTSKAENWSRCALWLRRVQMVKHCSGPGKMEHHTLTDNGYPLLRAIAGPAANPPHLRQDERSPAGWRRGYSGPLPACPGTDRLPARTRPIHTAGRNHPPAPCRHGASEFKRRCHSSWRGKGIRSYLPWKLIFPGKASLFAGK